MTKQHNFLVYLKLISHFDLAHKVPVDGDISFIDLAADIGINHTALARILRLGIANHVFKEPRPGVVAHSAASKQIADDPRVASWVGGNVDEMWPAAEKVVDALKKWPQAAEPNQTVSEGAQSSGNNQITTPRVLRLQTRLISPSTPSSQKTPIGRGASELL